MKVVKCKNGHFFDNDSYGTCPHCGETVNVDINPELPLEADSTLIIIANVTKLGKLK